MTEPQGGTVDLLVIGAGPAGAQAALKAKALGLSVLLVDEHHDAGGQVYRPLPAGFSRQGGIGLSTEARLGDDLRAAQRRAAV
ncbi:MAG: FAD-dependent oxidoreductase, partial [Oxalobacteraceae bacterium]